ncbi:hypothetical protein PRIC1_012009 [Phytophthora ramorum]|nr:hypothetical protein KRP22_13729 [Phytophthora ramorum]
MPTHEHDEASVLHRVATTGQSKSEYSFPDSGLRFSSRFNGGNMANVQLMPSGVLRTVDADDLDGSAFRWFHVQAAMGELTTSYALRYSQRDADKVLAPTLTTSVELTISCRREKGY